MNEPPRSTDLPRRAAKRHYLALDGLRGVAALLVVAFHLFEVYAHGAFTQRINHGYLAVDFFFLLSGFVVAYAYDDRWNRWDRSDRMSVSDFLMRRLIRLHPMVVISQAVGAALFYLQADDASSQIAHTSPWMVLLVMLIGMTLLPLRPSMDIRGRQESYPLNGPAWSLLFEYVANLLYALGIRKLSNKALGALTALSAMMLLRLLLRSWQGNVDGGWSFTRHETIAGLTRLLFPFFAGMLLVRLNLRLRIPASFLVCSILLTAVLCWPRVGTPHTLWANAIYEAAAILLIFPLIVLIGAGQEPAPGFTSKLCRLLGDLSYPLYITHFPFVHVYGAWVTRNHVPPETGAWAGVGLAITCVAVAYGCLRLYDEPVRAWLTQRLASRSRRTSHLTAA